MQAEEKPQSPAPVEQDRRDDARLPVDEEASLLLVSQSERLPCRIVEISLTGCRMRTLDRLPAGARVRVEATFKLHGIVFRFSGVTEWTDGIHLVGIRFADVTVRRMEELVGVLCEVAAENAAHAVKQAAQRMAVEEKARIETAVKQAVEPASQAAKAPVPGQALRPPSDQKTPDLATRKPAVQAAHNAVTARGLAGPLAAGPSEVRASASSNPAAKPAAPDRRLHTRSTVDTSATVLLVNVGSRLSGRILNLSLGGCRISTDELFPVGIYTRVETEFLLEGLPFRLGGVVQAIQDRQHVGIRFLDMSARKCEQVEQLIEEIEELRKHQLSIQSAAGGEGAISP